MKLLIDIPILLYFSKTLLQHPAKSKLQPLANKLTLLACIIQTKTRSSQKPGATNVSAESIRIINQSRHPSTTKKYDYYIGKWKVFCREKGIDPASTSLDQPVEFLTKIFESGVGYSLVGTARSALSSVLIMDNGISFGKHPNIPFFSGL